MEEFEHEEEIVDKYAGQQKVFVDKQQNICASTAGAGSGDFHFYRQQRAAERCRQRFIQDQINYGIHAKEFEEIRLSKIAKVQSKSIKKAEKRQRKKLNAQQSKEQLKLQEEAKKFNKFEGSENFLEMFLKKQEEEQNLQNKQE